MPLGRQRDSAAAAGWGPCSRTEQRVPRLAEVERHQQIDPSSSRLAGRYGTGHSKKNSAKAQGGSRV